MPAALSPLDQEVEGESRIRSSRLLADLSAREPQVEAETDDESETAEGVQPTGLANSSKRMPGGAPAWMAMRFAPEPAWTFDCDQMVAESIAGSRS